MKFRIGLVFYSKGNVVYERESKHDNFYNALGDGLLDIFKTIESDDCMLYDFEEIK